MTHRGKWAFQDKERAEGFVRGHGGGIVDFEAAMRASYEDMYEDTKAIRERRRGRSHKYWGRRGRLEEPTVTFSSMSLGA